MITLTLASQWHVLTPTVLRIMPSEYIDEFFSTGRIRLSSFRQFAKHPDEERGDGQEGKHLLVGKGTKQTVFAVTAHGNHGYILCGAAAESLDLFDRFGCDTALLIKDTTAFGTAVARRLPGLRLGLEGPCIYKDGEIECDIGDFELEQLKANPEATNLDLNRLGGFILNMAATRCSFANGCGTNISGNTDGFGSATKNRPTSCSSRFQKRVSSASGLPTTRPGTLDSTPMKRTGFARRYSAGR